MNQKLRLPKNQSNRILLRGLTAIREMAVSKWVEIEKGLLESAKPEYSGALQRFAELKVCARRNGEQHLHESRQGGSRQQNLSHWPA
jgi:hypothetical protein